MARVVTKHDALTHTTVSFPKHTQMRREPITQMGRATGLWAPACAGATTLVLPLLTSCVTIDAVHAQTYPTRPIRLIIPFPPGGPRDTQARLIAPRLTGAWGQQVVIDNRAGANGIIGTEIAAKAPPDGHTLLIVSVGFATAELLYGKLAYDPFRDFAPVAMLTHGPAILTVNPAVPVKSVKELIAHARALPGELRYGSSGNGSPSHLEVELLASMTGVQFTHVPYKGVAPALTDVLGGQIQMSMPTIPGGASDSCALIPPLHPKPAMLEPQTAYPTPRNLRGRQSPPAA